MFGQLVLHMREKEKESTNRIPQSRMCQCLLILCARSLNYLSESIEHLTGNANSFEKISLAGRVDEFLAGIVPIEVHDGFLESQ